MEQFIQFIFSWTSTCRARSVKGNQTPQGLGEFAPSFEFFSTAASQERKQLLARWTLIAMNPISTDMSNGKGDSSLVCGILEQLKIAIDLVCKTREVGNNAKTKESS